MAWQKEDSNRGQDRSPTNAVAEEDAHKIDLENSLEPRVKTTVFPRLREQLLPRRIHLVDVDMRWGVTSEQDASKVCREIITECLPALPRHARRAIRHDPGGQGTVRRAMQPNRCFGNLLLRAGLPRTAASHSLLRCRSRQTSGVSDQRFRPQFPTSARITSRMAANACQARSSSRPRILLPMEETLLSFGSLFPHDMPTARRLKTIGPTQRSRAGTRVRILPPNAARNHESPQVHANQQLAANRTLRKLQNPSPLAKTSILI